MKITKAKFGDASKTFIHAEIDGVPACIPADPANRHYRAIIEGVKMPEGEPDTPPVTVAAFKEPTK